MELKGITREWDSLKKDAAARAASAAPYVKEGKIVDAKDAVALLEAVIKPGDKVNIEGNNQKQADFLAKTLCQVDPGKVHDLHMVQSVLTLPEHLDVFEKGIAKKLDMSFSGPQAGRIAEFLKEGKLELGAIHTYLELYGRYFVDLTPRVALIAATKADRHGNLFTGFSTEDTPAIVEATKFRQGIVIAQVNEIVDELPRVDIPGDWVDYVIQSPKPFYIEPLFTRDPALITDAQVLKGMMAIKGIYGEYGIKSLNHGIGFDTAAIELLLPTYGEELGLKGKICTNFILNPHPSMIPAIESGWVESIHCFGGELGMDEYVAARSDIFFVGPDGSMRSNRAFLRRQDIMLLICLSAAHCRSILMATVLQLRLTVWQASAALRIWAATRKAVVIRPKHGLNAVKNMALKKQCGDLYTAANAWSYNWPKPSVKNWRLAS